MDLIQYRKWFKLLLLSVMVLIVSSGTGCRSRQWQEYRLFCGLSSAHGAEEVSSEEWEKFCDEVVAPEFPDGFTVCDASGRWLQSGEVPVREKTKILLILAPDNTGTRAAIAHIAECYRERFQQESVLIVRQDAEVEFK